MPDQSCIWSVCSRCVDSAGRIQSSLHTEKSKIVNQISSSEWRRHSSRWTKATATAWRYESLPATSSPLGPLHPHPHPSVPPTPFPPPLPTPSKHQQERLRWYPSDEQQQEEPRKQVVHLLPLLFIFSEIRKNELITLVVHMIYGLVPKLSSCLLICQWYRTQLFKKYNYCIRISTKLIEPLQPCGIKKREPYSSSASSHYPDVRSYVCTIEGILSYTFHCELAFLTFDDKYPLFILIYKLYQYKYVHTHTLYIFRCKKRKKIHWPY